MNTTLAHPMALAQARSWLAALADSAPDFYEAVHFEHLILALDALHPIGPALYALVGTRAELTDRIEAAVTAMLHWA